MVLSVGGRMLGEDVQSPLELLYKLAMGLAHSDPLPGMHIRHN